MFSILNAKQVAVRNPSFFYQNTESKRYFNINIYIIGMALMAAHYKFINKIGNGKMARSLKMN